MQNIERWINARREEEGKHKKAQNGTRGIKQIMLSEFQRVAVE